MFIPGKHIQMVAVVQQIVQPAVSAVIDINPMPSFILQFVFLFDPKIWPIGAYTDPGYRMEPSLLLHVSI